MAAERQYATASAFRTALEARLNERARRDGVDRHRLRRQVAFDRLLARMIHRSRHATVGFSKAAMRSRCDSTWRGRQKTSP